MSYCYYKFDYFQASECKQRETVDEMTDMLHRKSKLIPRNSHDGVLPPFIQTSGPHDIDAVSPYRAEFLEVAQRYATSKARIKILQGLLAYRAELRSIGFEQGFQWIDGSFIEDCESLRNRPPSDLDIVTFAFPPKHLSDRQEMFKLIASRPDLFDAEESKKVYHCDAYLVDLSAHPVHLVRQTRYWFGLFSHQRDTSLWKGMVEVPVAQDDTNASAFLSQEVINAS